jgi:dCTP deaminase
MAYLGTHNLTQLLKNSEVISPFDINRVKNGSYELSLGGQVFQTDSKPRQVKDLSKNEKIYIEPGQFALLLTEEYVKVPQTKIAFISIKAGVKFKGLVNVSGFHVDPGFEGKLLFSVYNAGPSTIVLSQGTEYFPIWFAELALNETQLYVGNHKGQDKIPDEPVSSLSQGELASPNVLSKRIDEVKHLKTKLEWVILAIFTAVIGLTIKFWTDSSKLKEAIDFGYKNKTEEVTSDSTYKKLLYNINMLNIKVDSLTKLQKEVKPTTQAKPQNNGKD